MSEISAAALLVVVGEPFSAEHKDLILERITKGLECWDVEGSSVDINEELANVASAAPSGEDGANGEKMIELASDKLKTEILINPQIQTLLNKLRQFMLNGVKYYHLVYAGHAFQGTGDWILQDDCMSLAKLSTLLKEADVENHIKQTEGASLTIATFGDGDWSDAGVAKTSFGKILKVKVNPEGKLDGAAGVAKFGAYLSEHVKPRPVKDLLQSSDVVGNIRFSRPTLYIFPGSQGDSALFGISGFNLLVNGGYNRKACFWDFTRHLDRIDAMLNTHLGPDNLFGLSSVLERKAQENVHPEIGYIYMNVVDKAKHSPNGDSQPENGAAHKPASLVVNLVEEGTRMVENLRNVGQIPHPCVGSLSGQTIAPINLYHKVGHGTLDMFILNPLTDSKDLKEFFSQWNKHVSNFSAKGGIPVPNACSVCALLVWRPASPAEKITRILFPGSAPQPKVFEGLDKLKTMDIFQHPMCSEKSLLAPKAGVKKAGGAAKPPAGKAAPTAKVAPTPRTEVKKSAPATKAPAKSAAAPKVAKEATNTKKAAAAAKSPASSRASSKAGSKSSTPKSTTPAETPKDIASPASEPAGPVNGLPDTKVESAAAELIQVAEPVAEVAAAVTPKEDSLIDVSAPAVSAALEKPKEPEVEATTPEMPTPPPSDPMTTSFIDMDTMGDHPEESAPEGQEPVAPAQPDLIQPVAVDETAAMPEVDQAPATPEEPPAPATPEQEKLPSPEALPEPEANRNADPMTSSFFGGFGDDSPVMDAKAMAEAGIMDDDEPEAEVKPMVCSTEQEPLLELPADVKKSETEDCFAPPEPELTLKEEVQDCEEAPVPELALKEEAGTQDCEEAPAPKVELKDDVEDCVEASVPDVALKPESVPDVVADAAADDKKQMEDLGIFDDDAPPAGDKQNDLADLDKEFNAAADDTKTLEDLGIFEGEAKEKESPLPEPMSLPDPEEPGMFPGMEELRTPRTPDHQDTSPEADHIPFNGESPQNLPEPEEPEPAMLDSDLPKVTMELQQKSPVEPEHDFLPEDDRVQSSDDETAEPVRTKEPMEPMGEPEEEESEEGSSVLPEESTKKPESPTEETSSSSSIPSALPETSHKEPEQDSEKEEDGPSQKEDVDGAKDLPTPPGGAEDAAVSDDDEARAEECDGSDVSGGLTADDLAQCPEPEVPLDMPDMDQEDRSMLHDSLMNAAQSPEDSALPALGGQDIPFDVRDGSFAEGNHSNPFLGLDGASGAAEDLPEKDDSDIPAPCLNGSLPDQFEELDRDSIERDVIERDSIEKEVTEKAADSAKFDRDSVEKDLADFDPLKSWGEPMQLPPPGTPTRKSLPGAKKPTPKKDPVKGWESPQGLPAPPPPSDGDKKATATKKDPGAAARRSVDPAAKKALQQKKDLSKTAPARTAAAKKAPATTTAAAKKTATAKPTNGVAKKDTTKNGPNEGLAARKSTGVAAKKPAGRPSTAPEKAAPKAAAAKRPGTTTATTRASPAPAKAAPPAAVVPFYVDLTYVPCHGDMHYMDWDFFRRVRARYYVISALSPSPSTLTALLEAKQTWDNPDLEVTIIPTFDNDSIRHWMALHRDQLAQLKIDVAPSANRCTIQLQDHETSCAAFRLEF